MGAFQYWFEQTVSQVTPVRLFMQTSWGWPATESVHFIGLTLLFGSIAVWDLRLLGLGRGVPISAFHRLVPFAVAGFAINVVTGSMFVMAEANQYVYNRAFQFKLLFLALAGLNVLIFYVTMFRRVAISGAGAAPPALARLNRSAFARILDGGDHLRAADHLLPSHEVLAWTGDRLRSRLHHQVTRVGRILPPSPNASVDRRRGGLGPGGG